MCQWINTNEQLPNTNQLVLFLSKTSSFGIAIPQFNKKSNRYMWLLQYFDNDKHLSHIEYIDHNADFVSYWCPIPDFPEDSRYFKKINFNQ